MWKPRRQLGGRCVDVNALHLDGRSLDARHVYAQHLDGIHVDAG
jgi:hypothetical protein